MRRGEHPSSRANLRPPWGPGQSGNPSGRRSLWSIISERMAAPPKEVMTPADFGMSNRAVMAMVRAGQKARVRCSVCRHKDLPIVDALLTLGVPIRAVARNYTLTRSAVGRHKQNHVPRFPAGGKARLMLQAEELLPPVIEKLKHVDRYNPERVTWPVFSKLWKALEDGLSDSPQDELWLCLASACVWLYRVQDKEDVRQAIAALESWGVNGGTLPAD